MLRAVQQRLWKTTNNGTTFETVFDDQTTSSIGDLAIAPEDPNLVWVGTGENNNRQSSSWGDGVYKSTDGGKTWKNMGLRESMHIARIVIDPTDLDVVYVAALGSLWGAGGERGVYKTADGGESFERVLHVDEALLHGPEQIADLPVPVAESPGAVRIGHPERSHLVEYLAPNSVFNSLPRQRSSPHLRPDDRLVTIDRVLHHASLGVA